MSSIMVALVLRNGEQGYELVALRERGRLCVAMQSGKFANLPGPEVLSMQFLGMPLPADASPQKHQIINGYCDFYIAVVPEEFLVVLRRAGKEPIIVANLSAQPGFDEEQQKLLLLTNLVG